MKSEERSKRKIGQRVVGGDAGDRRQYMKGTILVPNHTPGQQKKSFPDIWGKTLRGTSVEVCIEGQGRGEEVQLEG